MELTQTFENTCAYLELKYPTLFLGKEVVAHEMDIEVATIELRIASNMGLPPYLKIGNSNSSKFAVTLVDLAYYLSVDKEDRLSTEERREYIYQYLIKKYPRISLNKQDFSKELSVCDNTMGTYIKKGYVPKPKRHGTAHNSKITFNSNDIADFFSVVIQTM